MKRYSFKDGFKCVASTKEDAILQHNVYKATASDNKTFTVYVGDSEVNDNLLSKDDAIKLADSWKKKGYDDVQVVDTKTNKVTAANKVVSAQEEGQCFVLVPKDMLVNKNLILRCKKLWIKDARTVGVQEGLKHSKPARTLDRMIKLISEDM